MVAEGMMERKQFRARPARMIDQRIGPALRALRLREGRTLDEVAARCGVSRKYLSSIEQGRSEVSFPLLLVLAAALEVDPNYFASYQETSSQIEKNLTELLTRIELPAGS